MDDIVYAYQRLRCLLEEEYRSAEKALKGDYLDRYRKILLEEMKIVEDDFHRFYNLLF